MKLFTQLEKAEMVARWAHGGTTDAANLPYWTHCQRVAINLKAHGYDETIQALGWLHDVVEDTHIMLSDLAEMGFTERLLVGVDSMTQLPHEPLVTYWGRVKENPDSLACKLHGDIPDNNDFQRQERAVALLGNTTQAVKWAIGLRKKYAAAKEFLEGNFPDEAIKDWSQPTFDGLS